MKPFQTFTGRTAVLNRMDVDTDQIIPKQFLKRVERTGFGQFLFYNWRFQDDGSVNPDFELNQSEYQGASVLIAGRNFGCGSSREHAPWALEDYGFRVIIAPSFADIFYNNCLKNGILPITLADQKVTTLMHDVTDGHYQLTVDLENETITTEDDTNISFQIDDYWKGMLLEGKDEIDVTLDYEQAIQAYEQKMISS